MWMTNMKSYVVSDDLEWSWKVISVTASFSRVNVSKNNADIVEITVLERSEVMSAMASQLFFLSRFNMWLVILMQKK